MAERLTAVESKKLLLAQHGLLRRLADVAGRGSVASRMGKSYGGDRDLYEALGYPDKLSTSDYMSRYLRQDVARAIVDAAPRESWRKVPVLDEVVSVEAEVARDAPPTAFEEGWGEIVKANHVYRQFARVDRLAGIGEYAILLLGFADGGNLDAEVTSGKELLFVQPYSDLNAKISAYEEDAKNPRYGLPIAYDVTMKSGTGGSSRRVHWTRIIHVAEDLLEDNVKGMPRLQAVYNRLQDLELITGGSAEMFWRGGFPGFGLAAQPGATMGTQDLENLQAEMESYLHKFQRYIRTRNVDITQLSPQVADPSNHVSVLMDMISSATRIPKRILLGSERGELASSQDERNWAQYIDARRKDFCEYGIVRPFIDRLIEASVLKDPPFGYELTWDDLMSATAKETAEIGLIRSRSLRNYADSMGASMFVSPPLFFEVIMGLTKEEIDRLDPKDQDLGKLAGDDDADVADMDVADMDVADVADVADAGAK